MAIDNVNNLAYGVVSTAPSPATSGTALVATGYGANFPTGNFDLTMFPSNSIPTPANTEIARASVIGDTFTLTRAQYGTSAQSVAIGYQIMQSITKNLLDEIVSTTEAFATAAAQAMWPIGSIFLSAVATNPNTLLGFGTWSQVAQGQVLAGFKTGDANFGVLGGTGGATTASGIISHVHVASVTDSGHQHGEATGGWFLSSTNSSREYTGVPVGIGGQWANANTGTGTTGISVTTQAPSGAVSSISILPPYLTVMVWQRTA